MNMMKTILGLILTLLFIICSFCLTAGPQLETLSVSILNWNGTPAAGIIFPGGDATVEEPWVHSPQFLRVVFSTDELSWGVRIVTFNEVNIGEVYPKPLNKGPDNQWEWEKLGLTGYQYVGGQWQTGDDSVSFEGLIDPATKDNPDFRAALAWQVFKDPVPEPDAIYKHPLFGWNVGSNPVNWNGTWIYPREWANIVDGSNKWNGESVLGGVFYPPPAPQYSLKYEIVANGNSNIISFLAQYPPMQLTNPDPRSGDCDIAVYFAACFGIMENGQFVGLLPAGNYKTFLYVQLIHE